MKRSPIIIWTVGGRATVEIEIIPAMRSPSASSDPTQSGAAMVSGGLGAFLSLTAFRE
ncbi:hypothetical protein ACFFWD_11520 [Bradyrhizobium erythrophlei]|uniref:hypothetical protein n=1 Tax=Bradyrhizobium erythrophlei TaxID=1437360 RepID=UPI0035E67C77